MRRLRAPGTRGRPYRWAPTTRAVDRGHQEGPAGRAARLLRGRRPGRDHRREGARALRRAGLRAQADRAQQARRDRRCEKRGAIFVDETDEVPEGATVVFSAHGVAPVVHEEAARAQLKTIDATCPLVTKVHHEARPVRRRRLRHPADRPRGPRGGRGHRRRGARAHPARRRPRRRRPNVEVRDPDEGRLAVADHAVGRRDDGDRRRLRERFPQLQDPPSDDICYATQNRQVAVKQIAADADLVIVVGSRNSSNSVRLVEVALEHGARAGAPGRLRRRDRRRPGSTACTHGRRHQRAPACPRSWSATCSPSWPSAATATSSRSSRPRSLLFSLPNELRRDLKAARARPPGCARRRADDRVAALSAASADAVGADASAGLGVDEPSPGGARPRVVDQLGRASQVVAAARPR